MRPLIVVIAGVGLILAAILGWAVASGWLGGSSEPGATALASPSPPVSPTPPSEVPTGGSTATTVATPAPASRDGRQGPNASGEPALLYSEFGEIEDTLWLAPVAQLREPEALATVDHAPFWGISASLSPDGQQVAYVVLRPAVANPEVAADDQAEVWVQPARGGEPRFLAQNADVSVAPIWSPDGDVLVFQSFDRRRNRLTLFRASLRDATVSVLSSIDDAIALPLAFSPESDWFYVAQTSEEGTELLAIDTADGSVETLTKVAGDIARGWRLSPDGLGIAFVSRISGREWGLHIASLVDGTVLRLESPAVPSGRELFSPVWHPQQPLLTVGTEPDDGGGVLNVPLSGQDGERLAGPDEGFDVPIAWAPNGDYLVVQQFSEFPVQRRPSLDVISSSGERQGLAPGMEVTFIGWLAGAE